MTEKEKFFATIRKALKANKIVKKPTANRFKADAWDYNGTYNADIIAEEVNWGREAAFKKLKTVTSKTLHAVKDVEHYEFDYEVKKIVKNGFKGRYYETNPANEVIRKCKVEDIEFFLIGDPDGDCIFLAEPSVFEMIKFAL